MPEPDIKSLDEAALVEALYAAARRLNDLLHEAASRQLHIPITTERRNVIGVPTYEILSMPVYKKLKPNMTSPEWRAG